MAVVALKEYVGVSRDRVENYHGKQLVYLSWDHHMLCAAPFMFCVEPQMTFGDLVRGPLAALLQSDPDSASVDWDKVEWQKTGQRWTPDFARSIADNGIGHKEQVRFRTPGLNSLMNAT
jgi:phenol hydroxylase P4 protein